MAGRFGRDFQRSAVYRWQQKQGELAGVERITFTEATALVRKVWTEQSTSGRVAPRVWRSRGSSASYKMHLHKITLVLNPLKTTVLHEVAHALIRDVPETRACVSHGAEYCGVYIRLCHLYLGWSIDGQLLTAARAGVRVRRPMARGERTNAVA